MKQNRLIYLFYTAFISLILSTCSSCSQDKKTFNDWHRMNLKGTVKQIDVTFYASYQDLIKKNNPQKSLTHFNKHGLITKIGSFLPNNQIRWMKYLYKKDSVWIDEVVEIASRNEHPQTYWLYELDEQGNQKTITSILLDSSINFKIDVNYTEEGQTKEIVYSQQKYPTHVPCRIQKIYHDNGQIKEELSYHYNVVLKDCESAPLKSVFTVNEQGDITREVIYDMQGRKQSTYSYEYSYDEQNNWTQKLTYEGDMATSVTQRSFTYYQADVETAK